jgi:hypothetical protein
VTVVAADDIELKLESDALVAVTAQVPELVKLRVIPETLHPAVPAVVA